MAGKPGRSGGSRPGAGRPPKEPPVISVEAVYDEPEKFLASVMNDASADARLRLDAAKALLSAKVRRAENGGKKEAQQEAAKQVASKFAQTTPPKLVASGGKKI